MCCCNLPAFLFSRGSVKCLGSRQIIGCVHDGSAVREPSGIQCYLLDCSSWLRFPCLTARSSTSESRERQSPSFPNTFRSCKQRKNIPRKSASAPARLMYIFYRRTGGLPCRCRSDPRRCRAVSTDTAAVRLCPHFLHRGCQRTAADRLAPQQTRSIKITVQPSRIRRLNCYC